MGRRSDKTEMTPGGREVGHRKREGEREGPIPVCSLVFLCCCVSSFQHLWQSLCCTSAGKASSRHSSLDTGLRSTRAHHGKGKATTHTHTDGREQVHQKTQRTQARRDHASELAYQFAFTAAEELRREAQRYAHAKP